MKNFDNDTNFLQKHCKHRETSLHLRDMLFCKNFAEVFAKNPASPFTCTSILQFCSSIASPLRAHFVCSTVQIAHKYTSPGLQQKRTV